MDHSRAFLDTNPASPSQDTQVASLSIEYTHPPHCEVALAVPR
jgi:hypothetical protein